MSWLYTIIDPKCLIKMPRTEQIFSKYCLEAIQEPRTRRKSSLGKPQQEKVQEDKTIP